MRKLTADTALETLAAIHCRMFYFLCPI